MQIRAYKLRALIPPKDNLGAALRAARLRLREGDIVVIASKVVSIDEGRCIPLGAVEKRKLIQQEADRYFKAKRSRYRHLFTIARGAMVGSAGIDESNGNGHYILYPKNPFQSARRLRRALMREHKLKKLGLIITDSTSIPLRRGAIGFALAWDGIDPLRDYRGTPDIFGRTIKIELANLTDGLASAAVVATGEGKEQTPVAVIRGAPNIVYKNRSKKKDQLIVQLEDDIFAPLLYAGRKWKRNQRSKSTQR